MVLNKKLFGLGQYGAPGSLLISNLKSPAVEARLHSILDAHQLICLTAEFVAGLGFFFCLFICLF